MFARLIITLTRIIFGFAELIIVLRILLKFFGANPNAPFATWTYEVSNSLLIPFQGIFPSTRLEGGFVLEFSALFALIIYAVIAYTIETLLDVSVYRTRTYRD